MNSGYGLLGCDAV